MIIRFEFMIRVYIVYFMSCQKSVFDNLGHHYSKDKKVNLDVIKFTNYSIIW